MTNGGGLSRYEIKIHFRRVTCSFYARWLHSSCNTTSGPCLGMDYSWHYCNIYPKPRHARRGVANEMQFCRAISPPPPFLSVPFSFSLFLLRPPRVSAWMAGCKVTLTRHFECTLIKRGGGSCRRRYFPAVAFTIMVQTPLQRTSTY